MQNGQNTRFAEDTKVAGLHFEYSRSVRTDKAKGIKVVRGALRCPIQLQLSQPIGRDFTLIDLFKKCPKGFDLRLVFTEHDAEVADDDEPEPAEVLEIVYKGLVPVALSLEPDLDHHTLTVETSTPPTIGPILGGGGGNDDALPDGAGDDDGEGEQP
jgi:hypothetical protein